MRWLAPVAVGLGLSASGCLARSLAVDAEAVAVSWSFTTSDFGCNQTRLGAPDLPVVRIRSHIQGGGEDDELFDVVPCVIPAIDESDPGLRGVTTPLVLGSYEISAELWDRFGGQVLGRSPDPPVGVTLDAPGDVSALALVIEPI